MTIKSFSAILLLVALPHSLLALPATDRKIEDAAEFDWVKAVPHEPVINDHRSPGDKIAETIDDASIPRQVKCAQLSHQSNPAVAIKVTPKMTLKR